MRPFLTARWLDLLLVTWKVPDRLLTARVPPGLELDRLNGSAVVSLVAFDFRDTRAWGVRWPGLTDFPELNLRFYVRRGEQRGVCFLREYVPSVVLAAAARMLYNEPYLAVPYRKAGAKHVLRRGGRQHTVSWSTAGTAFLPPEGSSAHFLKEHSWGFGRTRAGATLAYRVDHPVWRIWPQVEPTLDVDFAALYGPDWSVLQTLEPCSVIAAEGSEVSVFPPSA
jgi:uncharacterized protein YqjF (DUF2071 family)